MCAMCAMCLLLIKINVSRAWFVYNGFISSQANHISGSKLCVKITLCMLFLPEMFTSDDNAALCCSM